MSRSRRKTDKAQCDPKETNLLLTEKPNCPKELQKNCDEVVFEQFGFAAYYRTVGMYSCMHLGLSELKAVIRSNAQCIPPASILVNTLILATGMSPNYRYLLLRHHHPTSIQRATHPISCAAPHGRRQATHQLHKRTFFAPTLQHDGRNLPPQ